MLIHLTCTLKLFSHVEFWLNIPNSYAEVSSMEWEFINMTEQEEDLIFRMHRLVGDR